MSRLTSWLTSRRIAIDLGGHSIKLLLAEAGKSGVRILSHRLIELKEEGLLSVEEVGRQLQSAIEELGGHELIITLPQHLAISQVMDLPPGEAGDINKLIERESTLMHERKESAMVCGHSRLKRADGFNNPYWVTMAREEEVIQQVVRFGGSEVADVVSTGNALITASLALHPDQPDAILAELGDRHTTVAILQNGQGVYATSFPLGAESFTEAFAAERHCTFEEADLARRTRDLFSGPAPSAALKQSIQRWIHELQKTVSDWSAAHPTLRKTGKLHVRLSGGGVHQPGLLPYLQSIPDVTFDTWRHPAEIASEIPLSRFVIAYGALLSGFGRSPQHASLLPEGMQFNRQTARQLFVANWISAAALVGATLFVLGALYGQWQHIRAKRNEIQRAQSIIRQAAQMDTVLANLQREQRLLQPILDRQKTTVDLLRTLDVLQQARNEHNIWFVLLADRQSYLMGRTVPPPDAPAVSTASAAGTLPGSSSPNFAWFPQAQTP